MIPTRLAQASYRGRTRLAILALVALLVLPGTASATKCDCKPEINAEAEGVGTCEKTQDDSKWCKLKFNSATGEKTPEQEEFFKQILKFGLHFDNVKASNAVNQKPPEDWDRTFVSDHLATLFAVALYDATPDRIPGIVKILQGNAEKLLDFVRKHEVRRDRFEPYTVVGSRGCLEFNEGAFSTLVKTRHSFARKGCAEVPR